MDNGDHRTLWIDDDGIIHGCYPVLTLSAGIRLRKPEFTISTSSTSSVTYLFNGNPLMNPKMLNSIPIPISLRLGRAFKVEII